MLQIGKDYFSAALRKRSRDDEPRGSHPRLSLQQRLQAYTCSPLLRKDREHTELQKYIDYQIINSANSKWLASG